MALNGFGSAAPLWRGQRGRALPSELPGASALQQLVDRNASRAAAQFWSPARTIEVTQSVIQPNGRAVSVMGSMGGPGLSGLGLINSAWCDSFEQAVDALGEAVRRGEEQGLTSANFVQAQTVYANETSAALWRRTPVGVWNCKDQTDRINLLVQALNKELTQPVPVAQSVQNASKPPEEMSLTAKFAIIGGITVAGIIGIAVITGQVAPLFRTVKRVF